MRLSLPVLVAVLVAVVVLSVTVGRIGARSAIRDALAVRRQALIRSPRILRWAPLVVGAGGLLGLAIKASSEPGKQISDEGQVALIMSLLLTGIGLVTAPGALIPGLSRGLASRARRLPTLLGLRRLEATSGASTRVVSSLIVIIFIVGVVGGVLRDARALTLPTRGVELYSVPLEQASQGALDEIDEARGVEGRLILVPGQVDGASGDVVIGTCAALSTVARTALPSCSDEEAAVILPPGGTQAGSGLISLRLPGGERWTTPAKLALDLTTSSQLQPQAFVPAASLPMARLPREALIIVASPTDPTTIDEVDRLLSRLVPGVPVTYLNDDLEARLQVELLRRFLFVALGLGLLVGMAAFLVATIDEGLERRGNETSLLITGVPVGTLRSAHAIQAAVTMSVGALLAVTLSTLADQTIARSGGYVMTWSPASILVPIVVSVVAIASAAAVAAFATRPRIESTLIRRE
jgi:hypothetical protein